MQTKLARYANEVSPFGFADGHRSPALRAASLRPLHAYGRSANSGAVRGRHATDTPAQRALAL